MCDQCPWWPGEPNAPVRPQEARRGDERSKVDLSQDSEYRRLTEGLRLAQQELDEARIEQFKADKEVTERTRSRYRWKEELDKHVQSLTK